MIDLDPRAPSLWSCFKFRYGQPLSIPPASPQLPTLSSRARLTCSCSISLYVRSNSRVLKRLWSLYMRVPSETGCTAKAFRKAELPSFSGSLFLASSNERYCCP